MAVALRPPNLDPLHRLPVGEVRVGLIAMRGRNAARGIGPAEHAAARQLLIAERGRHQESGHLSPERGVPEGDGRDGAQEPRGGSPAETPRG